MTSASQKPVTAADLRPVDLFDDLDDHELSEWAAAARWQHAQAGEIVVDLAEQPQAVLLLLDGSLQLSRRDGDRLEPAGRQIAPTWIGAVPVLTESPVTVRMVAATSVSIAVIDASEFRRLALAHPLVHQRIMHQVRPLMARITAAEQNRERLASLGTMAAGLAHELNNPAAAARRSAAELGEALAVMDSTLRAFVDAGLEPEGAARIADLREQALRQTANRDPLSALDAADAEDEMRDRLAALGIPDAWRLAEPLSLAGVDEDWLAEMQAAAGPANAAALRAIAAAITAQNLVSELRESTDRMS
jgi:CRP-like cAMP-binding protein